MSHDESKIEAVFLQALEIESADERAAFLGRACEGDDELHRRVERMLAAQPQMKGFLDRNAAEMGRTLDEPPLECVGMAIGPYKLVQQLGEGGMGTVFLAQQSRPVERTVALKLIKPGMDSRQVIARFEAERQALALMDHPNIARVLDAGTTDAGRPYFVMELVKGMPITRYCDQHRLSPRQRLELFLPICQAIQHAHQKGIIHRDVKPSNVLVAMYDGRPVPKVIDFGVAKATGSRLTDHTLHTAIGSVVGTFEYMSPEQAELNQLDVDTRTDIYSLGVLLYELLTGTTPLDRCRLGQFALLELLRAIREEEPPRPSTRISTAEGAASIAANRNTEPGKLSGMMRGELDWIVMRALEKDRARRYETATGLAMDVQRYLADEPVSACPPSAAYRLRKFARRNRARVLVGGMLTAAAMVVVASVGWAIRDRIAQRAETQRQLEARETEARREKSTREAAAWARALDMLAESEPLLAAGDPQDPELLAAANKAEAELANGLLSPDLRQRVQALLADIVMLTRLQATRFHQADMSGTDLQWSDTDLLYGDAFREYAGVDPLNEASRQQVGESLRNSAIAVHLASALTDWARYRGSSREQLLELACLADTDPWRTRLRRALMQTDNDDEVHQLVEEALDSTLPAASILELSYVLRARQQFNLAADLLRHGQQSAPDDHWLNNELAYVLAKDASPPRADEAVGYARAAVAIRPQSAVARVVLGIALHKNGDLPEAERQYREAIRIQPTYTAPYWNLACSFCDQGRLEEAIECCRQLHEMKPDHARFLVSLGIALRAQGKTQEAITCYQQAVELDPQHFQAHLSLGHAFYETGKLEEAIACYEKSVELDPQHSTARLNLGKALAATGRLEEAIACYQKIIELDPQYAPAHNSLGSVLWKEGRITLDEAIAYYRRAIELDPQLAAAHRHLGYSLFEQKKFDEAIACYRTVIVLDPDNAKDWYNLGSVLSESEKLEEAITCFQKAIELNPDDADSHNNLGIALSNLEKLDEAIDSYRQAIAVDPNYAFAWNNLGMALKDQGNLERAIVCYRTAIELDPDYADAWCNLGVALKEQEKLDEAIACFRKALERGPTDPSIPHYNLGNVFSAQGKLDEAISSYQRAIELKPDDADFWDNLGIALKKQGKLDAAIDCYQKAIGLDPQRAQTHYNLGNVLREEEKLDEAVRCYRQSIEIDPDYAIAWYMLGNVLRDERKLDEAVTCYLKAIEIDPDYGCAHCHLGLALMAQGKPEEAIVCYRKALEIDPQLAPAHYNLGFALHRQKKWDEAIACYQKTIELNAQCLPAYKNLTWLLATRTDQKLLDTAEFLTLARRAVELAPEDAFSHFMLGVASHRAGEFDAGIPALKKSMELSEGGNSFEWFFLAMTHGKLGNQDEARQWYDRAVEWMDNNRPDDEELRGFRTEAAALLGIPDPPTPEDSPVTEPTPES